MIDGYRQGHSAGFAIAEYRKAHILLSREELRPIAKVAIRLLTDRGYAHLIPFEEAVEGFIDGWLDWLYSYVPRSMLEAALSWGEPVSS